MSDEQLRALERGARRGDAGALLKWRLERIRHGYGVGDVFHEGQPDDEDRFEAESEGLV